MRNFERVPLWHEAAPDRRDLDELARTAALGGLGRLFDAPRPSFVVVESVVGGAATEIIAQTEIAPRLVETNIARAAIMYAEESLSVSSVAA